MTKEGAETIAGGLNGIAPVGSPLTIKANAVELPEGVLRDGPWVEHGCMPEGAWAVDVRFDFSPAMVAATIGAIAERCGASLWDVRSTRHGFLIIGGDVGRPYTDWNDWLDDATLPCATFWCPPSGPQ